MEEWKYIDEYYAISNKGRLASCKPLYNNTYTEWRIVKGTVATSKKAIIVRINKKNEILAKIVAEYFLPKEEKKKYIRYKDGNYKNTSADNLYWTDEKIKTEYRKNKIVKINEGGKMLKKINKRISEYGMKLRIVTEGLVDYLELGNADLVTDKYASVQMKNRGIRECLDKMMINTKSSVNLKKLIEVFNVIEEVVDEYESSNSN